MEKKKNSGMLVGILIGLVIAVIVVGGLFVTGAISFKSTTTNDNEQTNENTVEKSNSISYTYKQLNGLYNYDVPTSEVDEEAGKFGGSYNLYLYENGTYVYSSPAGARYGQIGNYIIENDNITLNSLFTFGSGLGINTNFETKQVTIQDINTLKVDNTVLSKTNNDDFIKYNDFNKMIENHPVINEYTKSGLKNTNLLRSYVSYGLQIFRKKFNLDKFNR